MMTRREWLRLASGTAAALGMSRFFPFGWSFPGSGEKKKLLMFTRSQGFQHPVVARKGSELSLAERIVTALGDRLGIEVTCTKDGRVFLPDEIAKFDAFLFETQGEDLTQEKSLDGSPAMPPEGKKAFLDAIAAGKGFIGCHCASDTFHSPGKRGENQEPDKYDPYIAMLGGEFISHGDQQPARMKVVDPKFPGVRSLKSFDMQEEWYALKNFAPDLHVILVQETDDMKHDKGNAIYDRPSYPATWARMHGKGRVFYTSMGHREDVWESDLMQGVLTGALSWVLGNIEVDVKPNIDTVAPKAMQLKKE
jgi:type 1 glutamine amidotransferase